MTIEMETFLNCFRSIYSVTNVPKYRSFQYRLLHRSLITNVHLYHYKIRDNNRCSFCHNAKETYLHLFVYCNKVRDLWIRVEQLIKTFCHEPLNFNIDTVIANKLYENPGHVGNLICLLTKQYIYRNRCLSKSLDYYELKNHILTVKNMEKYIAMSNQKLSKHLRKWGELANHEDVTNPAQKIIYDYLVNEM